MTPSSSPATTEAGKTARIAAMSASTLQLTMRSRSAMYGAAFVGLSALFLFFVAEDFRDHRPIETMIEVAVFFLSTGCA